MEMDKDFLSSLLMGKPTIKSASMPSAHGQAKLMLTAEDLATAMTTNTSGTPSSPLQDCKPMSSPTVHLSSALQATYAKVTALNQSLDKQFNNVKAYDPYLIDTKTYLSGSWLPWGKTYSTPSLKGNSALATGAGTNYHKVSPKTYSGASVSISPITQWSSTENQLLKDLLNGTGSK